MCIRDRKGTTLGAVTDIEGKFTILNVPGTAKTVIVLSLIHI